MYRVLHVATTSATLIRFVEFQAEALIESGYAVEFACSSADFDDVRSYFIDMRSRGWIVHDIPFVRDISPLNDIRAFQILYTLVKRNKYDIVHSYTSKAGIISRLAARLAGVSIVLHTAYDFHFMLPLKPYQKAYYSFLEYVAAKLCTKLFFITESIKKIAEERHLKHSRDLVLIGIGIDDEFLGEVNVSPELKEAFSTLNDQLVLGTVARLVWHKRIDLFLRVAERLSYIRPDFRYLIVGDGPQREELKSLSIELGISDKLCFAGYREDFREIPQLMSLMDLFFLPTIKEGFGLVFAEAMALRRPVIGYDIPPINEVVINQQTGILLPLDADVNVIANIIAGLADDNEKRIAMGNTGRDHVVRNYARENVIKRLLNAYSTVIEEKMMLPNK